MDSYGSGGQSLSGELDHLKKMAVESESSALRDELQKRHEHARNEADRLHVLANEQDRIVEALGSALDRLAGPDSSPTAGSASY